jgi:hypothetical protein
MMIPVVSSRQGSVVFDLPSKTWFMCHGLFRFEVSDAEFKEYLKRLRQKYALRVADRSKLYSATCETINDGEVELAMDYDDVERFVRSQLGSLKP